jgi:serine/threonine-protein phosphatase 6 regulatory ankyrin repeat subunit B
MQALQAKQIEAQKYRDILANKDGSIQAKSIDERIKYCKDLQYVDHQKIFAVMYSTIHKAAQDNSLAGMRFFLAQKKPKIHIDEYDKSGSSPIHWAAEYGNDDAVAFCVEKGCDVNFSTTYGTTALMLACKENHVSTVEVLFRLGASLSAKNKAGSTAIHFAAQGDHVDCIRRLLELTVQRQEEEDAAARAAAAADLGEEGEGRDASGAGDGGGGASAEKLPTTFIEEEDSMLDQKRSNVLDGFGATSVFGHELGGSILLNDITLGKVTPLMTAAQFNSIKVVEYLVSIGVPVEPVDASKETALHKAGRKGCFPVYKALVVAGASEKVRNAFNETPKDLKVDNIDY